MFCTKCGHSIQKTGLAFCSKCGNKLNTGDGAKEDVIKKLLDNPAVRKVIAIIAGLAVLMLVCVYVPDLLGNKPSNSNALTQIRERIAPPESIQNYTVSDLTYINGYKKSDTEYIVGVKYGIKFKKSLDDISKSVDDSGGKLVIGLALIWKFGDIKAGDSFDISESYRFLKTENGWILQNIVR